MTTATASASALPSTLFDAPVEESVVHEIADVIRNGQDFIIAGHLRPDGDCLGSCFGLYEILRTMGKRVRFYTAGPVPSVFSYLPNIDKVETTAPTGVSPDAYLFVDSADQDRVDENWRPEGLIANIDHHITNTNYGRFNWVDAEATAAAEQIYRLALVLDVAITPAIATCLYTGLMTDTGGFRFGNTDQMTFRAAAHLVTAGADPAAIAQAVFESRKPTAVRITGEVYSTLKYEFDGRLAWNAVDRAMVTRCGCDASEPEGLSSDLRAIDGVEVGILLLESADGWLRIGFRSRGKIDVAELAQKFGGGGHKAASGATVRKPFPEAKEYALGVIREYLAERFNASTR